MGAEEKGADRRNNFSDWRKTELNSTLSGLSRVNQARLFRETDKKGNEDAGKRGGGGQTEPRGGCFQRVSEDQSGTPAADFQQNSK